MISNDWNAALYDEKHAFVFECGRDVVATLNPQPGERILDVGCGTGHLTQAIADAGARVVGIDNAPAMIEAARAAHPTLEFLVADACDFAFSDPFDAVFSNAALHWIHEPERPIACIARALKPGGRFAAELGGAGNVSAVLGALESALREVAQTPLTMTNYFPSVGEYAPLLEKHGLRVESATLFARPTPLSDGEAGLRNWIRMFRGGALDGLSADDCERVLARVEETLRPTRFQGGRWIADYVRLRILAHRR